MSQNDKNQWLRFALPLTLGAVSALCYWYALSSQIKPQYFTQVREGHRPGDVLGPGDFQQVAVSGQPELLAIDALPWTERAVGYGAPVYRTLRPGQIVCKSDLDLLEEQDQLRDGEQRQPLSNLENVEIVETIRVGAEIQGTIQSEEGPDNYAGPFRVLRIKRDDENRIISMEVATRDLNGRPDPEFVKLKKAARNVDDTELISIVLVNEQA